MLKYLIHVEDAYGRVEAEMSLHLFHVYGVKVPEDLPVNPGQPTYD